MSIFDRDYMRRQSSSPARSQPHLHRPCSNRNLPAFFCRLWPLRFALLGLPLLPMFIFGVFPEDAPHVARGSDIQQTYAMLSVIGFLLLILVAIGRTDDGIAGLGVQLIWIVLVGTGGMALLLAMQKAAMNATGLTHGGASPAFLWPIQFVGQAYNIVYAGARTAGESVLAYTAGVGLAEETVKALPLFLLLFNERAVPQWKSMCIMGLTCGVGFGVCEAVHYAIGYHGVLGPEIYLIRFSSCVALHAIWTATVALLICRTTVRSGLYGVVGALLPSVILHALYDILATPQTEHWRDATAGVSFVVLWTLMVVAERRDRRFC